MRYSGKKVFALILSAVMLSSAMAGCQSNPAPASSTPASSAATDASQPTDTAGEVYTMSVLCKKESSDKFDFSTRDKFLVWQDFEQHAKEMGLAFEFELVPNDQYPVTIQTRMAAASKLPDMVHMGDLDLSTSINLGKQGTIQDLLPIIEQYCSEDTKKFWSDDGVAGFARSLNTTTDGNMFWVASVGNATYKGKSAATPLTMIIRQDWLKKLNLPVPTTTDELRSTLKAFQDQDANGNGAKDEVFRIGLESTQVCPWMWSSVGPWFGLVDDIVGIDFSTDKVTSPWYQEGVKAYFTYMNQLYKDGTLDIVSKEDQLNAANSLAALNSWGTQTWMESGTGVEGAEFLPLAPLKAVDGITPKYTQSAGASTYRECKVAFTKNCTDTQAIAKMIDLLSSKYYFELSEWGIEGKTFEINSENGQRATLIGDVEKEERKETGISTGYNLWGWEIFPRMAWEEDLAYGYDGYDKYKTDWLYSSLEAMTKDNVVSSNSGVYYALPTDEQQAKIGDIKTDLTTYSLELMTKLIIGEASLDNWDSYIEQLKKLGLDDMITIYQDQYDRYLGQ